MEIIWLGQGGLLFKTGRVCLMIDPYLSNSVEKINSKNYRRVPVDEQWFSAEPDILLFTHGHLDHYDPETVERLLQTDKKLTVLAPTGVWERVRQYGGDHNYVLFNRHTQWSHCGLLLQAVAAVHSDPAPIGVVLDDGEKKYYVTGDTLYSSEIFQDLPEDITAVFLPINGEGNNMNVVDAMRFCGNIAPQIAVPIHFGMFDQIDPYCFEYPGRVIPQIYQRITLE